VGRGQRSGTGTKAKIEGRDVCAKTGTAQVFKCRATSTRTSCRKTSAITPGSSASRRRTDPQIAFAIFVQNGGHGGTVGAPIARSVLEHYFAKRDAGQEGCVSQARRHLGSFDWVLFLTVLLLRRSVV